jgi:hypothetical protein
VVWWAAKMVTVTCVDAMWAQFASLLHL